MKFKIDPLTYQQLDALSQPASANQPEALPWVLYSTKTFTSASTTTLQFFDGAEGADLSLTNVPAAGQLSENEYFRIMSVGLNIMIRPVATASAAATGAIDDMHQIALTGLGRWELLFNDKKFGPFPISFLHASGGAVGIGWGTLTAQVSIEHANNGVFDGGFWVGGTYTIRPKMVFPMTMTWPAALTLAGGNPKLQAYMIGVKFRRTI